MSRPTRNTMIRQLQKAFRAGSRLKPLHCGKSCRGAVPIRNPMRRRTGKWPQGDPVLHPVLTHFLLKAADFITVHRAGKQFPECGLRDSGGNRNFYYAYFILFWNAEMKRNKQSKINLFLTRITICFLTAIGKPLHHNRVCLSAL